MDPVEIPAHVDPFTLPAERHGWRGLSLSGHHKRKWWTLLHNDQVLVTALLLIPGERSVRHSHETGELSIHYDAALHPVVTWHPPGSCTRQPCTPDDIEAAAEDARRATSDSAMAELLGRLIADQRELRERLDRLASASVQPRIIVDILFPPFMTTIDDPDVTERKTVVGQWYD